MKKKLFSLLTTLVMVVSLVGLMPAMSVGADDTSVIHTFKTAEKVQKKKTKTAANKIINNNLMTWTSYFEGTSEYYTIIDPYENGLFDPSEIDCACFVIKTKSDNFNGKLGFLCGNNYDWNKVDFSVETAMNDYREALGEGDIEESESFFYKDEYYTVEISRDEDEYVFKIELLNYHKQGFVANRYCGDVELTIDAMNTVCTEPTDDPDNEGRYTWTEVSTEAYLMSYKLYDENGVVIFDAADQDAQKPGIIYKELGNGNMEVRGYIGSEESIVIPNEKDGKPVTEIGEEAFFKLSFFTSIYIPESVSKIGTFALAECKSLKDVYYSGSETDWNNINKDDYVNWWLEGCNIHYKYSLDCDHEYTDNIIKDATCTDSGDVTHVCSICGTYYSETIPSMGHDFVEGVCRNCNMNELEYLQSPHPYENNYNNTWIIKRQNANKITITFSNETKIDSGDYISIYDKNGNSLGEYRYDWLSNRNISVKGDTIKVKLVTDSSGTEYGFSITKIEAKYDDYEYEINDDGTVQLTDYYGPYDNFVIPSEINGMKVTSIGNKAFEDCTNLKSITIPDGITSIGDYAFANCTSLTSVNIPNSITSIGDYAFSSCKKLESINIPDSVTVIGNGAFWHCSSLTNIDIPDGVSSIGYSAFSYCYSLERITIPDGVTSIGFNAFGYCSGLTSITIPDSVTSIENDSFYDCNRLKDIYYSGTEEDWSKIKLGSYFYDFTNATIHYNSGKPNGNVYYQTKTTDEETALRFVAELDIEDVQNAKTGSYTLTVSDSGIKKEITTVYRSIYAGGKKISAPEGKVYVITDCLDNLSAGDLISSKFNLSNYVYGLKKEIIV